MKKRQKRILNLKFILSLIFLLVVSFYLINKFMFNISTVRAFGDLVVDFHVPPLAPIFNISNMLPGDMEVKNVDVTNNGTLSRFVSVKGLRTGGVGADPKLETILDLVISDGINPIYGSGSPTGPKTLQDFFDESTPNGVMLSIINPTQSRTYNFKVTFPSLAGNDYQEKSVIFDLIFGNITSENLVINEVYYQVDSSHGVDSPKDRGILGVNGNNVTILIQGNGSNSTNQVNVNINDLCNVTQNNNSKIQININSNSNTGGNRANRNNSQNSRIRTGNANSNVNVSTQGGANIASKICNGKVGQNNEWVEIFNPTEQDISLKNYTLMDNSGNTTIIHANKIIKADGFAILAKDANTFTFWSIPASATKVELGSQIGDGLDNLGDHLILKNPSGVEVDRMSWGSDTSGFVPPGTNPLVLLGNSTSRLVPGFDTNIVLDWMALNPPSPGN